MTGLAGGRDKNLLYFYFEAHIEEASRTRNIRLKTRRGSVVSAVAGPSSSAETALFFCSLRHEIIKKLE